MPWSLTAISTSAVPAPGADRDPGAVAGVGDGVVDQVAQRGGERLAVAADLGVAGQPTTASSIRRASAASRLRSTASDTTRVHVDEHRLRAAARRPAAGTGRSAPAPAGQADALDLHPPGEPADRLGVVGGVQHRLGQQRQRPTGVLSSWLTLATKSRRTASTRRASVRSSTSSSTCALPSGATRAATAIATPGRAGRGPGRARPRGSPRRRRTCRARWRSSAWASSESRTRPRRPRPGWP